VGAPFPTGFRPRRKRAGLSRAVRPFTPASPCRGGWVGTTTESRGCASGRPRRVGTPVPDQTLPSGGTQPAVVPPHPRCPHVRRHCRRRHGRRGPWTTRPMDDAPMDCGPWTTRPSWPRTPSAWLTSCAPRSNGHGPVSTPIARSVTCGARPTLTAAGRVVLRFDAYQVHHRPDLLAHQVGARLVTAAHAAGLPRHAPAVRMIDPSRTPPLHGQR
jgi:hypothetical protein